MYFVILYKFVIKIKFCVVWYLCKICIFLFINCVMFEWMFISGNCLGYLEKLLNEICNRYLFKVEF